jgi:hypothetical protein
LNDIAESQEAELMSQLAKMIELEDGGRPWFLYV